MAANEPKLDECPYILIVEGYSDLAFYAEALEVLKKPNRVYIKQVGGRDNLRRSNPPGKSVLETFLAPPLLAKKTAIGVIVDADTDAAATSQSLETVLSKITHQRVKNATWTAGPPRIGLFVVPGSGKPGEIETLAWEAWSNDPANAGRKACVESFLACMDGNGCTARSPDKARIGAVLSVLSDEDPRLGPGARDRAFDFSRPEFASLLDFLRPLVA